MSNLLPFLIAPIAIAILAFLLRICFLRNGLLKNDGRMFVTHKVCVRAMKNGKIYIYVSGDDRTAPFYWRARTAELDIATLTTMINQLELGQSAQKKFTTFIALNFPETSKVVNHSHRVY